MWRADLVDHLTEGLLTAEADPEPDRALDAEDHAVPGAVLGRAAEQPLGLVPGTGRRAEVDQDHLRADVPGQGGVLGQDLDAAVPLAEIGVEFGVAPGPVARHRRDLEPDLLRLVAQPLAARGVVLGVPDAAAAGARAAGAGRRDAQLDAVVAELLDAWQRPVDQRVVGDGLAEAGLADGELHPDGLTSTQGVRLAR